MTYIECITIIKAYHDPNAGSMAAQVPVGTVHQWNASQGVPKGWLVCDGKEFDRNQYPDLYAILQQQFGGCHQQGTFKLPNMVPTTQRDRSDHINRKYIITTKHGKLYVEEKFPLREDPRELIKGIWKYHVIKFDIEQRLMTDMSNAIISIPSIYLSPRKAGGCIPNILENRGLNAEMLGVKFQTKKIRNLNEDTWRIEQYFLAKNIEDVCTFLDFFEVLCYDYLEQVIFTDELSEFRK